MSKTDDILKKLEKTYQEQGKEFDQQLALDTIKLTLNCVMDINSQFIGRRIGEIDLDLVYKDEFKRKKKKKSQP